MSRFTGLCVYLACLVFSVTCWRAGVAGQHFSSNELISSAHLKLVSTAFKCAVFARVFCQIVLVFVPAVSPYPVLFPVLCAVCFAPCLCLYYLCITSLGLSWHYLPADDAHPFVSSLPAIHHRLPTILTILLDYSVNK